jgi:hypothetical protein
MGATISLVRTSNPDGVIAAAGSMRQAVADVQRQIHFQQRHLSVLGQGWGGDAADSGNPLGPLTELPFSHEIGNGSAAFEPFESYAPQLPGGPRYPGDTVPYVPG